jgi:uncharacterized protein
MRGDFVSGPIFAMVIAFASAAGVYPGWGDSLPASRPGDGDGHSTTRPEANSQPSDGQVMELQLVFPGAMSQGKGEAAWREGPTDQVLHLVAKDGVSIAAVFGKGVARDDLARGGHRATLIYFYGNGMWMARSRAEFSELRRLGYDVIMPDYEGYGLSGGTPSEAGCYATADAVYDYLLKRRDVDPNRIVVVGWSIGSAVAIDLASRRPVSGLVAISAFTNLPDAAQDVAPWLPAQFLVGQGFDNLTKIQNVSCPILLVRGGRDVIVTADMRERLVAMAKGKTTVLEIPGAGHNDILSAGQVVFPSIQKFVDGL